MKVFSSPDDLNYLEGILRKLQQGYGMYIGEKSVHKLATFLCAYEFKDSRGEV